MLQELKKADPDFESAVRGYDPQTVVAAFQRRDQTRVDRDGTSWLSYNAPKQVPKSALKAPPGVSFPMTPTVAESSPAMHGDALTSAPFKKVTMSLTIAHDQAVAAALPTTKPLPQPSPTTKQSPQP